jgi:hypothetical protein
MLRSLERSSRITVAVLGTAAALTPPALAGGTSAATLARHHGHARRAHAHEVHAHKAAGEACGTPGANPRTCTVAPAQMPPVVGAIDGDQLAASGSITIPVDVSGPGTIRAVGDAAVGDDTIAATKPATATATRAGTVELTLTLTDAARARLAAGERLELMLQITASNSPISIDAVVELATA